MIAKYNLNIANLMQHYKIFISEITQQNSLILHTNSLWVCVAKVCSNSFTTYIIGEIKAKDNLNLYNNNIKKCKLQK